MKQSRAVRKLGHFIFVIMLVVALRPACGSGSTDPADLHETDVDMVGDTVVPPDLQVTDSAIPNPEVSDLTEETAPDDQVTAEVAGEVLDLATDPSDSEVDTGPPEPCYCPPASHCDETGECVPDVCAEGATTCNSPEAVQICNKDGSAFELVPCQEDEVCHLGECVPVVCSPDDPPACEDDQLKTCNSMGTDWNLIPCPSGTLCKNGECAPVQPNVILIVDTSGSMNWINWNKETLADCQGDDCAPWTWPDCDSPDDPQTRLARVKKALHSVIESEAGKSARLALQRFPQQLDLFAMLSEEKSAPTCGGTPLWAVDKATSDNTDVHLTHVMPFDSVETSLQFQVMPVPFTSETENTAPSVMEWIDFVHTYEPTGVTCDVLYDCDNPKTGKVCHDGACGLVSNPELRAMGNTPIGRSLFYAGEIIRHLVVVEGRDCQADQDCNSQHYSCVEGKCHDPMRACRNNIVVLFTDGGETLDQDIDKFFNPQVQAKRLHYGLGCQNDDDCLNGATCQEGVCYVEIDGLPDQVCHLTSIPCNDTFDCADYSYPCGPNTTCSGKCEGTGLEFVDPKNANVLRDGNGTPIAVTVHVVDASTAPTGNSIIAALGGGSHVPVDFGDIGTVVEATIPLLDSKNLGECE